MMLAVNSSPSMYLDYDYEDVLRYLSLAALTFAFAVVVGSLLGTSPQTGATTGASPPLRLCVGVVCSCLTEVTSRALGFVG